MAGQRQREDDWVLSVDQVLLDRVSLGEEMGEFTLGCILDALRLPRKSMKTLFDNKLVFLNDHKARPQDRVTVGDCIRLGWPKEKIDYEPIAMPLSVLYEDYDLLILDKPVGITVNSPQQISLANGVAHYFQEKGIKRKVRFLNRLDRDTSGCIVIAKSALAQSFYQGQMESNHFEKWYEAQVEGHLALDGADALAHCDHVGRVLMSDICDVLSRQCYTRVQLELPMVRSQDGIHYQVQEGGKYTRTDYQVLGYEQMVDATGNKLEVTRLKVQLFTGRTHQIRVAFSYMGYPLVGDCLYGGHDIGKPFNLRALQVKCRHMRTGERLVVSAE